MYMGRFLCLTNIPERSVALRYAKPSYVHKRVGYAKLVDLRSLRISSIFLGYPTLNMGSSPNRCSELLLDFKLSAA